MDTFWVGVAFFIFIGILAYFGVPKAIVTALDARGEKVARELAEARRVEPLMGWTSSADTRQQVRLFFANKEDAIAYATREGLAFRVDEPKTKTPRTAAYADNFRSSALEPWSH